MSLSILHDTAIEYARAGIRVFPCHADKKTPATPNGFNDATTDARLIRRWWKENPQYNIGVPTEFAGWAVIDEDPGSDPAWANDNELPDTYRQRTPRGGVHRIFVGEIPNSQQKLAPKVDTRGTGGYILVAPSIVDGKPYVVENDVDPAPLPTWVSTKLKQTAPFLAAPDDVVLDTEYNIRRGIHHLRGLPATHEGDGSDGKAFIAACTLRDLGISDERALKLMLEYFQCTPKDESWLTTKIINAYKYGENEPGNSGISKPSEEVFAPALAKLTAGPEVKRSRFYFEDDDEMEETRPVAWIVPDLIPENSIVLMTAKKGSFKTFLAMDLALGIATGKPTFGIKPTRTGPTFFGAHEGIQRIKTADRRAWRIARGVTGKTDFYVAKGPRIATELERQEFGDAIKARAGDRTPVLIVIDTYSAAMLGWDENSAGDANKFIAYLRDLIEAFPGCSVLIPAHFGKDESRGTRGTNALEAGVDTILDVTREEGTRMVSVKVRNHRNAPEREEPFLLSGRPAGSSLVFDPIAVKDYNDAKKQENAFHKLKVGKILKDLDAVGPERSLTNTILLQELFAQERMEGPEEYMDRLAPLMRKLKALARSSLQAYKHGEGDAMRWYLPTKD
jgi:hypothetical protein